MTTPLFLLRSVELGISIRDLDLLTIGLVLDMWTEKSNDGVKYKRLATQETLTNFKQRKSVDRNRRFHSLLQY